MAALGPSKHDSEPWHGLAFPVALLLFGLAMANGGKNLGKDDQTEILKFLRNTLDAKP